MGNYSQAREAIIWKRTECPRCTLSLKCCKSIVDLKLCIDNEKAPVSVGGLIKKTLRFMCAKQRKQRRSEQGQKKAWVAHRRPPVSRKAVLYCADIDEFTKCQTLKL